VNDVAAGTGAWAREVCIAAQRARSRCTGSRSTMAFRRRHGGIPEAGNSRTGTGGAEGIAAFIAVPNHPPSFQLDEIFQDYRHDVFPTYTFIAGG
jgi:hypothetical protein